MADTVTRGIYRFFDADEMALEKERYKDAVKQCASDVASDSVDGEAFTYGPRRDMSLEHWGIEIQNALAQLDPDNQDFTPSAAVVDMS